MQGPTPPKRLTAITNDRLFNLPALQGLPADFLASMKAVAKVLPFKVNQYVVDELIDWSNVPDDPMFQLTFPQPGMLSRTQLARLRGHLNGRGNQPLDDIVREIRAEMNPHPGEQKP